MVSTRSRVLVGIPVYNEQDHVARVLGEVRRYADDVLVIDDGSTDQTPLLLARQRVEVIRHAENRGYGRSMQDMLRWATFDGFDWLITMDCDEQHEPAAIPRFIEAIERGASDVISGSRYLRSGPAEMVNDDSPPEDRRAINATITAELNCRLGLALTDAFCGFKAYRVASLSRLRLTEDGYAMPLELWVQAARLGFTIREAAVPLIYLDEERSFGGALDDAELRLAHYRDTIDRALAAATQDRLASAPDPCVGLSQRVPAGAAFTG